MATGVYRRLSRINWIRRIFYKPVTPPGFFCPEFVAVGGPAVSLRMDYSLGIDLAMSFSTSVDLTTNQVPATNAAFNGDVAVDFVGDSC